MNSGLMSMPTPWTYGLTENYPQISAQSLKYLPSHASWAEFHLRMSWSRHRVERGASSGREATDGLGCMPRADSGIAPEAIRPQRIHRLYFAIPSMVNGRRQSYRRRVCPIITIDHFDSRSAGRSTIVSAGAVEMVNRSPVRIGSSRSPRWTSTPRPGQGLTTVHGSPRSLVIVTGAMVPFEIPPDTRNAPTARKVVKLASWSLG